jgi:hypothetical protein
MNLVEREQDEDQEAFLPKARDCPDTASRNAEGQRLVQSLKVHLRLVVEIFMALLIFVLLVHPPSRTTMKPSAVPNCMSSLKVMMQIISITLVTQISKVPLKTYTFVENPRYLHEDMFSSQHETLTTLHKWIELSSGQRILQLMRRAILC